MLSQAYGGRALELQINQHIKHVKLPQIQYFDKVVDVAVVPNLVTQEVPSVQPAKHCEGPSGSVRPHGCQAPVIRPRKVPMIHEVQKNQEPGEMQKSLKVHVDRMKDGQKEQQSVMLWTESSSHMLSERPQRRFDEKHRPPAQKSSEAAQAQPALNGEKQAVQCTGARDVIQKQKQC